MKGYKLQDCLEMISMVTSNKFYINEWLVVRTKSSMTNQIFNSYLFQAFSNCNQLSAYFNRLQER